MAKYKVMMTDTCFTDISIERELLERQDAELVLAPSIDEDVLIECGKDADGVIFDYAELNEHVLNGWKKCKVVSRVGIGVNTVDIPAAGRCGIMVANVPDYCLDEVADHAMALFLAVARRIVQYNTNVHGGSWEVYGPGPMKRLQARRMCLVGFGHIAQNVAKRAQAFGLDVYAFDPYVSEQVFADKGVTRVETMEKLAEKADVLSIHVPLTEETEHSISKNVFSRMPEGAILINTARGPIVDEKALTKALQEGKLMGAGLDTVEEEPLPMDSPLREMGNVIITPHVAFLSEEAEIELRERSAQEVMNALLEGAPHSFINRDAFA